MSKKPEGIPEEIWDAAVDVTKGTMAFGSPRLTEAIARTIMAAAAAEREAIIALVDYMAEGEGTDFGLIAAIRKRGQE